MIDRHALEQLAIKHLEAMGSPSGASLVLHLHNGEKYTANNFLEFYDRYCVVLVYPHEPLSAQDLGRLVPKDARGALIFDRLLLPYQSVMYVTITAREPESRSTIGFHG